MRQNHHLLVSRKLLDTLTLSALLITVFGNWLICQVWSVQITPSKWANIFISRLNLKVLRQRQNEADICRRRKYRAFPFTWPTAMQLFCNKSKCLHKRSVELSQDWLWFTNMAAVSLFWNTKMASVTWPTENRKTAQNFFENRKITQQSFKTDSKKQSICMRFKNVNLPEKNDCVQNKFSLRFWPISTDITRYW